MSQLKKALERARAERLTEDITEEGRDPRPAPADTSEAGVCYTRTRVVEVSAAGLLQRRIVAVDEGNPLADQFKRLRTNILKQTRSRKWNTIAVSGFGPDEGKSLVAVNLAISIAQDTRQTTVLVDLHQSRNCQADRAHRRGQGHAVDRTRRFP
jgi:protein-tyrosine kinase